MRIAAPVLTALLLATSCGDPTISGAVPESSAPGGSPATTTVTPTTGLLPAGRVPVIRWVETGGCMVLGPNCPTWVVHADGSVDVTRTPTGPDVDTAVQAVGTVDTGLVAAVISRARATDEATLAAELGPGSCQSCVDGADVVVSIIDGDRTITLDSLEVAFDPDDPLIAALDELMASVRTVELPVISTP